MLGLVVSSYCEAHDAFYPHPHMRDLKAAAKRGKILVITLVVSAGLVVLISTALIRGDKEKDKADAAENITPAELRTRVIAAVVAGRDGLAKGYEQALKMALSTYANACSVQWENGDLGSSPSVTRYIGKDQVTVTISGEGAEVEVRVASGKMGASATIDTGNGSIRSSIFAAHAQDRGVNDGIL
jgi:hypothetical protein